MVSASARSLAESLDALANPTRIVILKELTSAKPLHRIRVPADDDVDPPRLLSRQAVRQHLDRLVQAGAVLVQEDGEPGAGPDYLVNHARLYALGEEVQALAALRPHEEPGGLETQPAPGPAEEDGEGARLVLVRGLRPGTAFPLRRPPAGAARAADGGAGRGGSGGGGSSGGGGGAARWVVGRRRGAEVSLDYDPFVSAENAVVTRDPSGAWSVEDVPGSRNGTFLNFRPLTGSGKTPLRHGDLVGVGRSILVFWER